MEIAKNKTVLNKKTLEAFQNQEIFRKSWMIALCAVVLIVLAFTIKDGKVVLNSIPFLVIGAVIYPAYIVLLKCLFIKQNKSFNSTTLDYTFTEDKIFVTGVTEGKKDQTEIAYGQLEKVRQSKKYLYLYINKVSALVVDKNNFSVGSSEKLLSLLKLRFKEKLSLFEKNKKNRDQ